MAHIDTNLLHNESPADAYYNVLNENGGPMYSSSPSYEPRDLCQARRHKASMKKDALPTHIPVQESDLQALRRLQRNPVSLVRTAVVYEDFYIAFLYSNKVNLGPTMLHFTKDEGVFRRFCLEIISANP